MLQNEQMIIDLYQARTIVLAKLGFGFGTEAIASHKSIRFPF
jgi:hypothetical protein